MAGPVHPHVRLQVESIGQTLSTQLALYAPGGGVPPRLVVVQTGPRLEPLLALLAPEQSLSVNYVNVRMKTASVGNLLVAVSQRTGKSIFYRIEMLHFIMFL